MMHTLRLLLCVLISLTAAGCALPPSGIDEQQFVPRRDIVAVSLTREALASFAAGRFIDAALGLHQASYLFPEADNIKTNLAITLERLGDYDAATQIFTALLEAAPSDLNFKAALARVSYASGDPEDAKKRYADLLEQSIAEKNFLQSANVARSISSIYFEEGLEEQALCMSELAFNLRPEREELLKHVQILFALDRSRKARTVLQEYLEDRPGERDAAMLHALAIAAFGEGDYTEALRMAEMAEEAAQAGGMITIEMRVVKMLAEQEVQHRDAQDVEQDEDSEEQQLPVGRGQLSVLKTLFWPYKLVLAHQQLLLKLEEQEL